MVALGILDAVLSADGELLDRSRPLAEYSVRTALSDLAQIDELNAVLMSAQFDRKSASLVRGMYEEWVRQVEALEKSLLKIGQPSNTITGIRGLRDADGRVRAMLSVSLDDVEEAEADLDAGRTIPLEEVRRELRLGVYKASH